MKSPERLLDHKGMFPPLVYSGTNSSAAKDTRSARYLVILPYTGAITAATGVLTIEESATGAFAGEETTVPGASHTITAQNTAQAPGLIRLHGRQRYIRGVLVVAGTSFIIGVSYILFDHEYDDDFSNTFEYTV